MKCVVFDSIDMYDDCSAHGKDKTFLVSGSTGFLTGEVGTLAPVVMFCLFRLMVLSFGRREMRP